MKSQQKKTEFKFFDNGVSTKEDLTLTIIIQFRHQFIPPMTSPIQQDTMNCLVQNFLILPEGISKYLSCETKIKNILFKNYINKLFIGDINDGDLRYMKTEYYGSNVFDVYYEIKNAIGIPTKPYSFEVTIPKKYIIEEKELLKCETCISDFNCEYKKRHKGKGCSDWCQI